VIETKGSLQTCNRTLSNDESTLPGIRARLARVSQLARRRISRREYIRAAA
jgi:hypothetical protein